MKRKPAFRFDLAQVANELASAGFALHTKPDGGVGCRASGSPRIVHKLTPPRAL